MRDNKIFIKRTFRHSKNGEIVVWVSAPRPTNKRASTDWEAEYQIIGMGSEKIRKSYGVDAVQAITLALSYIATHLYVSEDYQDGCLTWCGSKSGYDLGLPVADTIADLVKQVD